ncbi:hypothetical protein MNV49_001929 [Pseudohyphozyma bogoriensis]|nr:hypothetical protein MNV49_001929 [Pseudohyphozyma bogoriensis]
MSDLPKVHYQPLAPPVKAEFAASDDEEQRLDLGHHRGGSPRNRAVLFLAGAVFFLVVLLWCQTWQKVKVPTGDSDLSGYCSDLKALPVSSPKKNIWKNLDVPEAIAIRKWLFKKEQGLNLTSTTVAEQTDNIVFLIEAHRPSKADALAYLDSDAPEPDRYAHVVIHHGAREKPVIVDYLVGPLPVGPSTTLRPLAENYEFSEIPINARAFVMADFQDFRTFLHGVLDPYPELMLELFGVSMKDNSTDPLSAGGSSPVSFDGTWRKGWIPLKLNVPGSFLRTLDCYLYVDMSSLKVSEWKLIRLVYNHQIFPSMEAFNAAWLSKTLVRSPKVLVEDSDWATRTRKGHKRDLDHLAGPRSVSFDGPRFRADLEEQFITWMGWSMHLGFTRDMGLQLWNINFRGERIIYELAPQEAMAQYSGNDPGQASTVWLDSAFGMGAMVKDLVVGYDCPADALYLPATVHTSMGSSTRLNAVCVFERDTGRPLTRHYGDMEDETGASKTYELVVRSVSTVGNYDYIFDYTFGFDGSVEVRFSASGYLQGGYWDPKRQPYGTRIRETSSGAMHDHVINYKVDLDVAGTDNSISSLSLEVKEIEEDWFDDEDWGKATPMQTIIKTRHATEATTQFEAPKNGEGMLIFTNEAEKNAWGESRGYAVHPGVSNVHLTNLDAKRTLRNVQWAKKHAFVSRAKDTEPKSSSMWNMNLPGKPAVNFDSFFNDESVDQKDLVLWMNLGTHHVPRAEDSPNTLTNLATSYFLLVPFNYFDYDVSLESLNSVVLNQADGKWTASGHIAPEYCIPPKLAKLNYTGMMGWKEDGTPAAPDEVQDFQADTHGIHMGLPVGASARRAEL